MRSQQQMPAASANGQQRYLEFDHPDSYISPTLGCMGPGVPSAVAAKLAHPNRTVIAHIGDGGFLMTGQEMATAKQFGAHIISIVYNNEGYNSIRMHQEAQYPGRQHGMALENPDFALMGEVLRRARIEGHARRGILAGIQKSYGGQSLCVDRGADGLRIRHANGEHCRNCAGKTLQGE